MRFVANLLYLIGAVFYVPVLCYQMVVQGKNRRGWRQRFGHWPIRPGDRPRIWLHAVSLGEINATPLLVAELQQRLPDHEIVISTTTDTGFARASKLYGPERVFRYPLDFSWMVRRVLRRVQPSLIVLVELEVWYNLVRQAARRAIPVAVVNGRLTARSRRRFGRLGSLVRPMFRSLAWVGAQDQAIATRFVQLGVPAGRVETIGSVKWDTTTVADRIDGQAELAQALGTTDGAPLWVCGSTGPGEEAILLEAYGRLAESGSSLNLALVPRKPERFDEVAELICSLGYNCIRRSQNPDGADAPNPPASATSVILGDTMGELRKFYSLASVVFVGRSLVPMGGSDPMEVAALAKPVIVGPHTDNFAAPVRAFAEADAIRVVQNVRSLVVAIHDLMGDPQAASEQGARARQVVLDNQGATGRTADSLATLLGQSGSVRPDA